MKNFIERNKVFILFLMLFTTLISLVCVVLMLLSLPNVTLLLINNYINIICGVLIGLFLNSINKNDSNKMLLND